jgi:hypothetical protein
MSDDQMRGLKDLLRTESNDPPDVTAPLPRPTTRPAGRARGLSALTEAAPGPAAPPTEAPTAEPTVEPTGEPTEPAAVSPAARPRVAPRPARPARSATDTAPSTPTDPSMAPRRKTSVTLPPVVRDRVADAYHRSRWTLLTLLELAGERLAAAEIRRADVEAVVASLSDGGGSASIRSLSVPASLLDQFDELSSAWRLSRSALIAACLVLVLEHLPE